MSVVCCANVCTLEEWRAEGGVDLTAAQFVEQEERTATKTVKRYGMCAASRRRMPTATTAKGCQ